MSGPRMGRYLHRPSNASWSAAVDHSADTETSASTTWGGRKLFSPSEADRALVLVQRITADIVAGYPELLELQEMLEEVQQHGPADESRRLQGLIAESVSSAATDKDAPNIAKAKAGATTIRLIALPPDRGSVLSC